jgi:hypothetical protein
MSKLQNFLDDYIWSNIAMEEFFSYADEITKNASYIYNSFKNLCNEGVNEWEAVEIAVRRFINNIK